MMTILIGILPFPNTIKITHPPPSALFYIANATCVFCDLFPIGGKPGEDFDQTKIVGVGSKV